MKLLSRDKIKEAKMIGYIWKEIWRMKWAEDEREKTDMKGKRWQTKKETKDIRKKDKKPDKRQPRWWNKADRSKNNESSERTCLSDWPGCEHKEKEKKNTEAPGNITMLPSGYLLIFGWTGNDHLGVVGDIVPLIKSKVLFTDRPANKPTETGSYWRLLAHLKRLK